MRSTRHSLPEYINDFTPYRYPEDFSIILSELTKSEKVFAKKNKERGNVNYYNVPASFDIEDTSTYIDGKKAAFMYIWQFSINGKVILGRTWEQFIELIGKLSEYTDFNNRLIVYVHYLSHEFAYIQTFFNWESVFCKKERDPIYALTDSGIEFRDSYILTSKSLAKSAEDLTKYKVKKLVGDLDYSKIRGPETDMTEEELGYCVNDCLVVDSIIREKMEEEGNNIAKIPLTNTGYVRREFRQNCYPTNDKKARRKYREFISHLTITPEEYRAYKRAFAGGFTHASALWSGNHFRRRVDSMDFTSSYPAVMVSERFPMSVPEHIPAPTKEQWDYAKKVCSIFDVRFTNIRPAAGVYENPISVSKCITIKNKVENNGRLVSASSAVITITNIDYQYIRKFYVWDKIEVKNILQFHEAYLPKAFIKSLLYFYKGKTELKGVAGKETEYMKRKGMTNSAFGCTVTDIVKDEVVFENGWMTEAANIEESLEEYNKSQKRFLYYPWGVFITAYARRNLFSGIYELGEDYIYSDTDSVKFINYEKHTKYFENYNKIIVRKIDRCLTSLGIDPEESRPKTVKGEPKQLGVWDWETKKEEYTEFKTLGAKRYMYRQGGDLHITVAGLSKKDGLEYIKSQEHPFEFFKDGMRVDKEHSGRLTHTYIDDPVDGVIKDYNGKYQKVHSNTCVHLEKSEYTMTLSNEYEEFLRTYRMEK